MRIILLPLTIWAFCGLMCHAEEIEVYACAREVAAIHPWTINPPPETNGKAVEIELYRVGAKLGTMETGTRKLEDFVEKALSQDRSGEPFFGPGFEYLLRDDRNRYYVAFYEYRPGKDKPLGIRFAIAPATDLGSIGKIFVGHVYEGVCFDENLLKQFKVVTDNTLAQQVGGHEAASRPESKEQGEPPR